MANNSKATTIAAGVLTLVFLAVSGWILATFGVGDHGWDHVVVVYNALTSIAFTAVGVLLGAKVQQVNVNKANDEAKAANAKATTSSSAIKTALSQLETPSNTKVDESGGGSISAARSTLLRALD